MTYSESFQDGREQGWRDANAAIERERQRADEADNALRNVSLNLGGTDEWSDQASMIGYVENLALETKREAARLREALWMVITCEPLMPRIVRAPDDDEEAQIERIRSVLDHARWALGDEPEAVNQ